MLHIHVFESSTELRTACKAIVGCFNVDALQRAPKELVELMLRHAAAWSRGGCDVLTTNEHVVNGIRLAVKRGILTPDDVDILWYPEGSIANVEVRVDVNGALSEYPNGFMDTWNDVLLELMTPAN